VPDDAFVVHGDEAKLRDVRAGGAERIDQIRLAGIDTESLLEDTPYGGIVLGTLRADGKHGEVEPSQRTLLRRAPRRAEAVGTGATLVGMCRNIRTLHNFEPVATEEEIRAAALQYVRKVSGSTKPSRANVEVFDRAVEEVAVATARLLDGLVTSAPPRDREVEAARRRARAAQRYAA
jgi:hypothetical protein